MSITERIATRLHQLRSLFSKKEKMMSDQTVIEPTTVTDISAVSPLESFANEIATPAASSAPAPEVAAPAATVSSAAVSAMSEDVSASVKDFTQAFNFVEQGVEKLGAAAKDELIALARKYL